MEHQQPHLPPDCDVEVRVKAARAAFTVPAFGAERRTYPFPTPSALKGMLESIFWKPEFAYEIARMGVLQPGTEAAFTRSELQTRQTPRSAGEPARTLRTTSYLRNVEYLVQARLVLREHAKGVHMKPKYLSQLARRLERGAHFQTPYLGLREFVAEVSLADGSQQPCRHLNADAGLVFFGHAYGPGQEMQFRRRDAAGDHIVSGSAVPFYFPMQLRRGWIEVPRDLYAAIAAAEHRRAA